MNKKYEDIIDLTYSGISSRKPMSMMDRAAQFSPFAALTGYDTQIQEAGRRTEDCVELDPDETYLLNKKLQFLTACCEQHPEITVTFFIPDSHKQGGAYVCITEKLKKLDLIQKVLFLMDGSVISFDNIRELWSDLFLHLEAPYGWKEL